MKGEIGAAADYLLGNYLLNRDAHMGEFVEKMLEAGVISVAGDAAFRTWCWREIYR